MKLWLLYPVKDLPEDKNLWLYPYDKAHGFVARATSEEDARLFASEEAGQEARNALNPWLDKEYTECVELLTDGEAEIVLRDFCAG